MSKDIFNPITVVKTPTKRIVKLVSSAWSDSRGIHVKRSILYMKRMGDAEELLSEDASMVGADETASRITNLLTVKDGLYSVMIINEHRDWETGHIEDYDFFLVPYQPSPNKP